MLPSAGHRRSDSGAGDGVTGRDAVCFIYSDFVVSGWGGERICLITRKEGKGSLYLKCLSERTADVSLSRSLVYSDWDKRCNIICNISVQLICHTAEEL